MAFGRALAIFFSTAVSAGATAIESPPPAAADIASSLSAIRFLQPAEGSSLHEGETVEIHWSGVPGDADEIELLLSVDAGHSFSLRLTDELHSGSRSFLWLVPGLVADNACLAIRAGVHGREITSAPGPLFRLSRNPSTATIPLRWKAGEIWVESGDPGEVAGRCAPSTSGLSIRFEQALSAPDDSDADDLPRCSNAGAATTAHEAHDGHLRDANSPIFIGPPSRAPLSTPQRI